MGLSAWLQEFVTGLSAWLQEFVTGLSAWLQEFVTGLSAWLQEFVTGLSAWLQEFVTGLSVLARGTFHEKIQWAFSLYDVNGDGVITKEEMHSIVSAIYDMMGKFSEPMIDDNTAREHVDRVFLVS